MTSVMNATYGMIMLKRKQKKIKKKRKNKKREKSPACQERQREDTQLRGEGGWERLPQEPRPSCHYDLDDLDGLDDLDDLDYVDDNAE